jgi:hypothetical protein
MTADNNPFNPPAAQVSDFHSHTASGGELVLEGISQPGSAGIEWIKAGWELFKKAPGLWIAITVIFVIITIVLSAIPLVSLALNLLLPVFMGGMMLGCKALDEGEELTVGHLFAGFSNNFGNLVLVGLLYMAGIVVLVLVVGVVAAIAGIGGILSGGAFSALLVLPLILIGLLCIVPLLMALWFAPSPPRHRPGHSSIRCRTPSGARGCTNSYPIPPQTILHWIQASSSTP